MTAEKRNTVTVLLIAAVLASSALAADLMLPLGVAGGVPYVAVVLAGWWFPRRQHIFWLAVGSTALTLAGYYLSPAGGTVWVVLTNRGYALFAIWVTAAILRIARKSQAELRASQVALIAAKDAAEAGNRAKSRLLANMSHELRTPLNAIIGFSDVMIQRIFGPIGNEKYAEYVVNIRESGGHLLDLVNDVLDVTMMGEGKLALDDSEVDVQALVESSIMQVRPRAEEGRVRMVNQIDAGVPRVRADERRIRQVLINLLSNAVKFTPERGKVSVAARHDGDGSLLIIVADTGSGIAEADIAKVMAPFEQLDEREYAPHEGTGLGLPISRRLMEAHGGTLTIESEPGAGTRVSMRFPSDRVLEAA